MNLTLVRTWYQNFRTTGCCWAETNVLLLLLYYLNNLFISTFLLLLKKLFQRILGIFEAKARPFRGQGRQNLSSECSRDRGQSLSTPSHLHTKEYITLNSRKWLIASCCKAYRPNAVLLLQARKLCRSDLLQRKLQARPGLFEAKARPVQGQSHATLRPRPPKFVLGVLRFEASPCGPHPYCHHHSTLNKSGHNTLLL